MVAIELRDCPRPVRRGGERSGAQVIPYAVAHSLPGRVRLRIEPSDAWAGPELAARLTAHSSVSSAQWTAVTRSLLVYFDPAQSIGQIATQLRPSDRTTSTVASPPSQPAWRQFLAPALSLLAGLFGASLLGRVCIALCAVPIIARASGSLRERRVTIDVLDIIAVSLLLLTGDGLAAGVSVALIETGERIRRRANGRARRVLRGWMGTDARGIRVLRDGTEPRVPTDSISIGERVVIYAGETVPVDGVISGGGGLVDTSSWTGESLPRDAQPGGTILAGSGLADGRVVIEVTAAGEDTRAGRLAVALEEALAADTRVSDMARQIADRFVLPVLGASGLIFLLTRNVSAVVAMLIFDYGTGVRVAIPTTILTTMITGARRQVLFKSGRAVEELARVDTVVFDKTGTLTSGVLTVVEIEPADGVEVDDALRLAAAAEGHLPHPIARAIRRFARGRHLELPQPEWVRYRPGGGVEARVDGSDVMVGDRRLLEASGIAVAFPPRPESLTVFIAAHGRCVGRVRFRDRIRENAEEVVLALRRAGVQKVWLASGDQHSAAAAVSRQLGLDGYSARLMPESKAALVRRMEQRGHRVAVVGDGINDAPAMAEAHVSVAVTRGADLARETADVVLLSEDLEGLVTAIELSRSAMAIVRQNIGVVAVPNTVGMVLAGTSRISPLLATLLNNGSTLLGAANGLRPLLKSHTRNPLPHIKRASGGGLPAKNLTQERR